MAYHKNTVNLEKMLLKFLGVYYDLKRPLSRRNKATKTV
jgi:hypothetical protein